VLQASQVDQVLRVIRDSKVSQDGLYLDCRVALVFQGEMDYQAQKEIKDLLDSLDYLVTIVKAFLALLELQAIKETKGILDPKGVMVFQVYRDRKESMVVRVPPACLVSRVKRETWDRMVDRVCRAIEDCPVTVACKDLAGTMEDQDRRVWQELWAHRDYLECLERREIKENLSLQKHSLAHLVTRVMPVFQDSKVCLV